jgi:predicted amino acid racemase
VFLDALTRRNPALIDAAVELHGRGEIPPGSFVVDADGVRDNARSLARAASDHGVNLYFMMKQLGRNPVLSERIARWIPAAVAVDLDDAEALTAAGVRIGHVGHLVQPYESALKKVLAYRPEVVTVFGVEKARRLAAAAASIGREQPLLLRVVGPDDYFFPGQEGGIPLAEIERAYETIEGLDGVRVAGVTSFPAFALDRNALRPTPNLDTLVEAADRLGGVEQINAPGHTSIAVLPDLAAAGATHGEPGHSLTGTTPLAAVRDIEEVPATCFLTEVSHLDGERLTVFGGGFYERGNCQSGLLIHDGHGSRLDLHPLPKDSIDYYRHLHRDGARADVGDPAVFAFRFQVFTSRAKVATVAGVGSGQPELLGLHDPLGRPVAEFA